MKGIAVRILKLWERIDAHREKAAAIDSKLCRKLEELQTKCQHNFDHFNVCTECGLHRSRTNES